MPVIMAGGGVDSTTLLFDVAKHPRKYGVNPKEKVIAITTDYGQSNARVCIAGTKACIASDPEVARKVNYIVQKVQLPGQGDKGMMLKGYVPPMPSEDILKGRWNFGLDESFTDKSWKEFLECDWVDGRMVASLFYATVHATANGFKQIFSGSQFDKCEQAWLDPKENVSLYTDQGEAFHHQFADCMNSGGVREDRKIKIRTPFHEWSMDKESIARLAIKLSVPTEKTYSCYYLPACGYCPQCLRLYFLSQRVGIKLRKAPYANKPFVDEWVRQGSIETVDPAVAWKDF